MASCEGSMLNHFDKASKLDPEEGKHVFNLLFIDRSDLKFTGS